MKQLLKQMYELTVKVIDKVIVSKECVIFILWSKDLENFEFETGQFIRIKFNKEDVIKYAEERLKRGEISQEIFERIKARANKTYREFSLANPSTRKGYLELLVERENEGGFSPYIVDKLDIGSELTIDGPYGKFTLDESHKYIIFLAAGSGVAPIMGMIRHIADKKLDGKYILIYSNKTWQHVSYRSELEEIERNNENIKVYHTLTREKPEWWKGYTGRINAEMIKEIASKENLDLKNVYFYICGGPGFLKSMHNPTYKINNEEPGVLDILGIEKDKIKKEVF